MYTNNYFTSTDPHHGIKSKYPGKTMMHYVGMIQQVTGILFDSGGQAVHMTVSMTFYLTFNLAILSLTFDLAFHLTFVLAFFLAS